MRVRVRLAGDDRLAEAVEGVERRRTDPYTAAESLLAGFASVEAEPHE